LIDLCSMAVGALHLYIKISFAIHPPSAFQFRPEAVAPEHPWGAPQPILRDLSRPRFAVGCSGGAVAVHRGRIRGVRKRRPPARSAVGQAKKAF